MTKLKPPEVTITFHGKPFSFQPPTRAIQSVFSFLDKAPANEVFSRADIIKLCNVGSSIVSHFAGREDAQMYFTRVRNKLYFGNPRAIQALNKQIEAK